MARKKPTPWLIPGLWAGALTPVVEALFSLEDHTLGANPIAELLNRSGLLALVFLVASLGCTPLKTVFDWNWPLRIRRELGLIAFGYAATHFLLYAVFDQGLDLAAIGKDVAKRSFILVGFVALLILIPLAVTSTNAWVKRMGFARWKRLHRLAYAAGILGAVHFWLRVKKDHTEPAVYAALLGIFFAIRLGTALRERLAGGRKPRRAAAG